MLFSSWKQASTLTHPIASVVGEVASGNRARQRTLQRHAAAKLRSVAGKRARIDCDSRRPHDEDAPATLRQSEGRKESVHIVSLRLWQTRDP